MGGSRAWLGVFLAKGRVEELGTGARPGDGMWGPQVPHSLTLAAVTGSQQRLLILAVICKGRRSSQTPPAPTLAADLMHLREPRMF